MRSVAVAAGLVAVAYAHTSTVTVTDDVTVTSCEASVTDCPYKAGSTGTWGDWTSTTTTTPVAAVTTSSSYDPWVDWTSSTTTTPVAAETTSSSYDPWVDWTSTTTPAAVTTTSSAGCGTFTGTAPPAWFSQLPSDVLSSIEAKWTGAPPADWCYYSYSTTTLSSTPVAPVSSAPYWPAGSSAPVAPASGTGVWSYTPSSTPVSPEVATFTGAANANAGSLAFAGLAAAAALIMA